jgi:hypothetical protein
MDTDKRRAGNRMLRRAAISALVLLAIGAPAPALAAGSLDQVHNDFGASKALIGTHENGPDVQQGQVFTAGVSGLLDQVDLPIRVVGDPGVALQVEIRAVDGSGYPSTVLGSATVAQAGVPVCDMAGCDSELPDSDYTSFTFVSVPLSTPAPVSAGTDYAITLSATGATLDIYGDMIGRTTNRYEWAGVGHDAAVAGPGVSYVGGVGWYPTNSDRAFRTYVTTYHADVAAPINADGSSVFKSKGTVPVRFTLSLGGVATCSLPPATIAVTRTGGVDPGPVNETAYLFAADNGSDFRIAGCQYSYNLNSRGLGAGTYRVDLLIDGSVAGSASFELH